MQKRSGRFWILYLTLKKRSCQGISDTSSIRFWEDRSGYMCLNVSLQNLAPQTGLLYLDWTMISDSYSIMKVKEIAVFFHTIMLYINVTSLHGTWSTHPASFPWSRMLQVQSTAPLYVAFIDESTILIPLFRLSCNMLILPCASGVLQLHLKHIQILKETQGFRPMS